MNQSPNVSSSIRVHRVAWLAAGIRRAATSLGVQLPASYSEAVTRDGLQFCEELALTQIGRGVVIHTAPGSSDRLPIILGYADGLGQWYRNGQKHSTAQNRVELGTTHARRLGR